MSVDHVSQQLYDILEDLQRGALLEKYFDCDNLSVDDTEDLLKTFSNYVNGNKPDKHKKKPQT